MEPDIEPGRPAKNFPAKMKIPIFACFFCILFGAAAEETGTVTGSTSISTDELVQLLNLTVLKCQFNLPKKDDPNQEYDLEYWVEDWRKDSATPTIVDEGSIGFEKEKPEALVRFPDSHSPDFYISTSANSIWWNDKLVFEDKGATCWYRLSKASLEPGKPILIALRIDGVPTSAPAENAPLPEVFNFYRKHESIQIVAFYLRVKEWPEKAGQGEAANR